MVLRSIFLFCFVCALRLAAATPDETARLLAGLPLDGTSLSEIGAGRAWQNHAAAFDSAWKELDAHQLGKIKAWASENLQPEYGGAGNVFYFFSGPDMLYAGEFFPNAANYVLVALEPAGAMPEPEKIPADALAASLEELHKSMNTVLSFSFFITKKMKTELSHQQLGGTLPVILTCLSRSGAQIDSVDFVGPDGASPAPEHPKSGARGVKIVFTRPGSATAQNIYYFEANLADEVLKKNDAVLKFCDGLGHGHSLLKAASYLMHQNGFDLIKNYILTHSDLIVEDDSGIPFRAFDPNKWQLGFYGQYKGTINLFKKEKRDQPDLAAAWKAAQPGPLGFSFGYQWQPKTSGLIEARPK
jgi:hypothetical protein